MEVDVNVLLERLQAQIEMNAEMSNTRMGSVNEMIRGIIQIVSVSIEKQKVVEDALAKSQALSMKLADNNAELIEQIKLIRSRCSEISKENHHLHEVLRQRSSVVSIDNKQM